MIFARRATNRYLRFIHTHTHIHRMVVVSVDGQPSGNPVVAIFVLHHLTVWNVGRVYKIMIFFSKQTSHMHTQIEPIIYYWERIESKWPGNNLTHFILFSNCCFVQQGKKMWPMRTVVLIIEVFFSLTLLPVHCKWFLLSCCWDPYWMNVNH